MIRLQRPTSIPAILTTRGATFTADLESRYPQQPKKRFAESDFKGAVYNDASVQGALAAAQHDKCCYCESKTEGGQVEHYRPKTIARQKRQSTPKPGYFWLVHDWDNLLFACGACNSTKHKGVLFPLEDKDKRVEHPERSKLSREKPLLINPYTIDPEKHIKYNDWTPEGTTSKGKETVSEILKLDSRPVLESRRSTAWNTLELSFKTLENLRKQPQTPESKQLIQELSADLKSKLLDSAEFAAMARAWAKGKSII